VSKPFNVQSPSTHILVIGQQPELADRVQSSLGPERLRVSIFDRFDQAQSFLAEERPDLVICMLLSHFSLLHVCVTMKADRQLRCIPIMALANKGTSATQVAEALNAGADDCLVTPFHFPRCSLASTLCYVE
jgi:DNA-binding response OmpR family regulator